MIAFHCFPPCLAILKKPKKCTIPHARSKPFITQFSSGIDSEKQQHEEEEEEELGPTQKPQLSLSLSNDRKTTNDNSRTDSIPTSSDWLQIHHLINADERARRSKARTK